MNMFEFLKNLVTLHDSYGKWFVAVSPSNETRRRIGNDNNHG